MRLERLNYNKIKIFLTIDDLMDRGLTKEDLWKDSFKVHQLFKDMMNEASLELGFDAHGSLAVEVFSLQAQGMVVIVTKSTEEVEEEEEEYADDYIEMQVKLDESIDILYELQSFEDLIQLSKALNLIGLTQGAVYHYQERYFLHLDDYAPAEIETVIAVLAEYGSSTTLTLHRLQEYGKQIMAEEAVRQLNDYFQ
ncbi:genetic competence negative regulator [Bacillus mangrovi]|uniref:Adapter protein MecA n=1 Tax=Metabacillus mangrovi TaxID=1491830 RepID=A0A7X2S1W4_9BACI|nr:genetic competence negative regulator [Metabacillus mangrovi]MTH52203.1 genetic competence negative regulator [Metabacillus mangrovi]